VAGSSHENGFSRVRAEADEDSEVNDPTEFGRVLTTRERSQHDFNSVQTRGKQVSLADLVIVGGRDAVEHAARSARDHVEVAFVPGSTDESQGQIDAECFVVLGPKFDGFCNSLEVVEKLEGSKDSMPSQRRGGRLRGCVVGHDEAPGSKADIPGAGEIRGSGVRSQPRPIRGDVSRR